MQQVKIGQAKPVMGISKAAPAPRSKGKMREPVNTSILALQSGINRRWYVLYRPNAKVSVKTPMSSGKDNDKEQIFAQITIS